jgi:hypothetical protein
MLAKKMLKPIPLNLESLANESDKPIAKTARKWANGTPRKSKAKT